MSEKTVNLLDRVIKEINKGQEFEFFDFINELERTEFKEKKLGQVEDNVVIKGKVYLEEGAIIKSGTYIEGDVYIGKNSIIGPNAYLRKKVIIGTDCHIANSEVKNSIIGNNSNAAHFAYIGDSILGENVNLGAGTKIANLRHDKTSILVNIRGKVINSQRTKLGACLGTNVKTGINSSINCGKFVKNNTHIMPGQFFS